MAEYIVSTDAPDPEFFTNEVSFPKGGASYATIHIKLGFMASPKPPEYVKDLPVIEGLRATAALLQEHGHAVGTMYRPEKGYCAMGGLNKTYTGDPYSACTSDSSLWAETIKALASFLAGKPVMEVGEASRLVVGYNDKAQVNMVQAMLQCANLLETYTLPPELRPRPPQKLQFFSEPACEGPSELPPPPNKEREMVMV